MIRYVRHAFIDRDKYDQCIKLDRSALIYGLSWYLDTVCENWNALVLNDYDAVWPLPVRNKLGFTYFFRPYGIQQLGIFSRRKLKRKEVLAFISEMQKNCVFADVYLNSGQLKGGNILGVKRQINNNFTLRIDCSYREVYEGFSKNTRRNIKKAGDYSWQLFEHDSPEVLLRLFRENRGAALDLPGDFYKVMEKVIYAALHRNMGHIWTLYGARNELCGGIFVLEFYGRLILLFTGLNETGKEQGAMYHLLNEYIIHQCEKNSVLDFEGSNNAGLARFYAGFGATLEIYERIVYNGLPFFLKWLK